MSRGGPLYNLAITVRRSPIGVFIAGLVLATLAAPRAARAQTDEIQVYDASIAPLHEGNLTTHTNFTPDGATTPFAPGVLISNHSINGSLEWAYGAEPWLELGLYFPLYSFGGGRGPSVDGGKLRFLFVRPNADDHKFFYGMNFEFSYNARHWDPRRYTSEIRPIIGWRLRPWDLIFNPVLDNNWAGVSALQFNPCARVAYHLNPRWAVAGEEYAQRGTLARLLPPNRQFQQVWGVADHYGKVWDVEAGFGLGVTPASDALTLKLLFSRNFRF